MIMSTPNKNKFKNLFCLREHIILVTVSINNKWKPMKIINENSLSNNGDIKNKDHYIII